MVEIVALAGFEGIILDIEHGAHQSESLGPLILAARARGIYPLVRVRSSEPAGIAAALDAGAAGIIVPQIGSAEEARRAVAAARFAPEGNRGANPFVRAADYSGRSTWFAEANRDVAVLLMIEGAGGVAELPQILETPALDGIFIGPMDLSHALGVPGDMGHETVIATIEAVIAACDSKGMATGIFAGTPEAARRWMGRGVTLVGAGVDTSHLLAGLRAVAKSLVGPAG
ncbi:MAG TPA: aldolase/citrate lyase family protein [Devosia sp.]|nr:aldolase/citrate lyase family protein [Devosia sp.]